MKIVRSRWVDGWKTIDGDPRGVRSRCVAQEVNTSPREDVHSGTPPLKAHRMILSCAATKRKGQHQHDKLIGRYDVSVAFFHATSTGKIAVVPPDDLNDQRHLWYLNKAMNGTREASRQWSEFVDGTVTRKGGFSNVPGVPGVFYHKEWQVTMSCHGDDFLAEGRAEDLDKLDESCCNILKSKCCRESAILSTEVSAWKETICAEQSGGQKKGSLGKQIANTSSF